MISYSQPISTHTPLAGRDDALGLWLHFKKDFYSHAPRGARHLESVQNLSASQFLLTRPSRGATGTTASDLENRNFYSHAPRGARQELADLVTERIQFLLTRPSRGATCRLNHLVRLYPISTHTPLAGRDKIRLTKWPRRKISTHTPLAGRDSYENKTGIK